MEFVLAEQIESRELCSAAEGFEALGEGGDCVGWVVVW